MKVGRSLCLKYWPKNQSPAFRSICAVYYMVNLSYLAFGLDDLYHLSNLNMPLYYYDVAAFFFILFALAVIFSSLILPSTAHIASLTKCFPLLSQPCL